MDLKNNEYWKQNKHAPQKQGDGIIEMRVTALAIFLSKVHKQDVRLSDISQS